MKLILINPPFSDPMVPPPALAALAELFSDISEISVYDLSLDVFDNLFKSSACSYIVDENLPKDEHLFGKRIKLAFDDISLLVKLKQLERRILNDLSVSYKDPFRVGRCSLQPSHMWPPSALYRCLSEFCESVFGQILKDSALDILPDVLSSDCIIISITFDAQILPAIFLCQFFRQAGYQGLITAGGVAISLIYKYLASLPTIKKLVDHIFIGELSGSAQLILDFWAFLLKENRKEEGIVVNVASEFFSKNLSHPPIELLSDGSGYTFLPLPKYWGKEPLFCVAVTKGCYFSKCAFCAYGFIKDHEYIANHPTVVKERLLSFQEQLGTTVFCLETDVIDPATLVGIASQIKASECNLTWHGVSRFESSLSNENIESLYEGGCRRLYFGLESVAPNTLHLMKKNIDTSTVKRILHQCAEVGIGVEVGVVLGFPGEQLDDALLTLEFLNENSALIHRLDFSVFRCVRNSPIAVNPKQYGIKLIGPGDNWYTLEWEYSNNKNLSNVPILLDRASQIRSNCSLLDISEDIWLVCRYGVESIESQLMLYADNIKSS